MLNVQYRMHPALSKFPSLEFYNEALRDGTVDSLGNISSKLTPPYLNLLEVNSKTGKRPSLAFLDHAGPESMQDRSRVNRDEANIVCSIVGDLLLNNDVIRASRSYL